MADVAIDPQNANPKELYGQGVRAFVLQDYDTAVRAFSKSSEILSGEHGSETHDSLGDVYLYYGKSLLELSRKEGGPLGEGILKSVEEESESEEAEEGEGGDEAEDKENGAVKEDGEKTEESGDKAEDEAGSSKNSEDKDVESKDEATNEESQEEGASSEEKKDEACGEPEEDLTDLQVAWEVLELAKQIFTNRGDTGKENLAETLIVLGEISLESGNFLSAIEDVTEGLKIQKSLFGNDSRTIAETYYKLGGAYATNGQIDEAVESFSSSLDYLKNKIDSLQKDEKTKEASKDEIEELNNLLPEIQEKIADMKNLKTEVANKVAPSKDENAPKLNGNSEASSSRQVNDISHLVKRKRKEADVQGDNPAKKPSP